LVTTAYIKTDMEQSEHNNKHTYNATHTHNTSIVQRLQLSQNRWFN